MITIPASAVAGGRRPWRRASVIAVLAATVSAIAAACGGSSATSSGGGTSSSSGGSPVNIGYILPLTGFLANNAKAEQDGFKLGLKTFGSTINGHPIKVTYLDDGGTPAVSLSDATQLTEQDHVVAVEGPLVSSSIAVTAPYVMGHGAVEDDLYLASPQQMNDYVKYGLGFTSGWTGYQPSSAGAKWAYDAQGWRHVTVIANDFSFGWQTAGGFEAEFTQLGGKIDQAIFVPSNAVDLSSYISQIPSGTQALWVELSGGQAVTFVNDYASFGLKSHLPLLGITQLTDQSALPSETPAAALGVYTDSQYCDGDTSAANTSFASAYHSAYGAWPSYYSDAGYTKAEILVTALKSLNGDVTSEKALASAMKKVRISAPRGPVTISPTTYSPVQDAYICKVENVNGALRNVPIKTYSSLPAWGLLTQSAWTPIFAQQSTGRPS